jgi:hypothetical protein
MDKIVVHKLSLNINHVNEKSVKLYWNNFAYSDKISFTNITTLKPSDVTSEIFTVALFSQWSVGR